MIRLPFVSLVERIERRYPRQVFDDPTLGVWFGVSRDTVQNWRRRGLDPWQADRLATAAGFHPCQVWPEWCDLIDEAVEIYASKHPERMALL